MRSWMTPAGARGAGRAAFALGFWLGIGSAVSAQAPDDPRERAPTLTVTGTARASAEPDQAVVRLGVVAENTAAAGAQDQANRAMQQVLEAVARLDVPERAVRTEDLSLTPVYSDFRPRPDQAGPQEPRITGYRASSVVSVELDDLDKIGDVVDAGIEAGANQLQGISFQLRDDAAARTSALRDAVEDARVRAEAVADAMGMRIEGVMEVVAGDYAQPPPVPYAGARYDVAELAATPVQPGEVEVSASVIVTYTIAERSD